MHRIVRAYFTVMCKSVWNTIWKGVYLLYLVACFSVASFFTQTGVLWTIVLALMGLIMTRDQEPYIVLLGVFTPGIIVNIVLGISLMQKHRLLRTHIRAVLDENGITSGTHLQEMVKKIWSGEVDEAEKLYPIVLEEMLCQNEIILVEYGSGLHRREEHFRVIRESDLQYTN